MVSQSKKRIRRFSFAVKIVILDDELEFSKILDKKIKAYCARKDLLYDCKIFSSSKSLLSEDLSSVQAAFLDIDAKYRNCHWVLFVRKRVGCSRPFSCFVSF